MQPQALNLSLPCIFYSLSLLFVLGTSYFTIFAVNCLMATCANRPACCKATAAEREGAMTLSQPLTTRYHQTHPAMPKPELDSTTLCAH
jgi:hypothetical protein